MSRLTFTITSPARSAVVGRDVSVAGRAHGFGIGFPVYSVEEVRVAFGGGTEQVADLVRGNWKCVVTAPPNWPGGTRLRIVATARGQLISEDQTAEPFEQHTDIEVVLDGTVPDVLTIDSFASPVTTQPGRPYVLDLSGTAGDAQTGISAVRLRVDNGPFADVVDVVPDGSGLWRWKQKQVPVPAGVHHFTARAVDGAGNLRDATADISVRLPFEPGDVEQVFQPTRYLLDLRAFTERYVRVAGSPDKVTPALLAARFRQPFDRLTEPAVFEQATRPAPHSRIAVEVLRRRLGGPAPAELDRRFRGLAYETFLRTLGTSYDELRLARTADAETREALAGRLGIGLVTGRPDRLDELTVSPAAITDGDLEALSGYSSTAPGDPLRAGAAAAKMLLWRRDRLNTGWLREDEEQRDSADGPRPVLDPDVIGEGHLRNRQAGDPAFALWTARRAWIADTVAQIERDAGTGGAPPARFDRVVSVYIGTIDLPALAAQDADGVDVRPDLVPFGLGLEAFRFLARARGLLAGGALLDTEWLDIVSILLQVQKGRRYRTWRLEERRASLVLGPASFVLDPATTAETGVSPWRSRRGEYAAWRNTLATRVTAAATLERDYERLVDTTESLVLPRLRDALVGVIAAPNETPDATAERLGRELMIDLRTEAGRRTSRVDQAVETLQGALFSARAGRLATDTSGQPWTIDIETTGQRDFDREWAWMGAYRTWQAAARTFAYPENQLLPAIYVADPGLEPPTPAYRDLIDNVRKESRLTPDAARTIADTYLKALRALGSPVPADFVLTDDRGDADLVTVLQPLSVAVHNVNKQHAREVFWLVPMALAAGLQDAGHFQTALDWYRTVFAYQLPPANRRIYHGLLLEAGIVSTYDRVPEWLIKELNPHLFARQRRNCYTRATIMAITRCVLAFADAEFARSTADTSARARTLYETAADLLELQEARPESGTGVPFPANPLWMSLREHSRSGLAKIHRGLNIAGASTTSLETGFETVQPSQYRYGVVVERAKNLVATAQQVESAYLSSLEQRDAKTYDEMRAAHDLQVAGATVAVQELKVTDADTGRRLAELQRARAQLQEDHFDQQIRDGLNAHEQAGLTDLRRATYLQEAAGVVFGVSGVAQAVRAGLTFGLFGDPASAIGQSLATFAGAFSTAAQFEQTRASYERRAQDWRLQRGIAATDVKIGDEQIALARGQYQLALAERDLAGLNMDHAEAVARFLATRFTNAELFEWMSGVLGRVYAYFLQQATALAQLAEAQLAFERQEQPAGFIGADYWRDATADAAAPDRRGLTGSARLLQDVNRLDQYAFDTDRRKLHITQTFPLSQVAAFELQQFRDSGVLTFATPQELYDRDFPGHYLRLVKRIRISLVALLPPVRGVRATLSASGVSRTVVARGPFDTVTLRRQPESVAFTSATNATGMFELEPENGLLLPFEGMGVDTVWQLELPKAANPFDYRSIADVLLTVEYTALDSPDYRERVVRRLDRRFSGDRAFSLRNQFPDAWYDLNNPDTVEPARRMRAVLPLTTEDFPPHVQNLSVAQLSLFVLRKEELADELTIRSLSHTVGSQTTTVGQVRTNGGVISTRRPAGSSWQALLGEHPAGSWEIELVDDALVRAMFTDELIEDVVLVVTVSGSTAEWP